MKILRIHAGLTLVELLVFMGIVGVMSGAIIPMLISATESRQRQDAIALVEQNGEQILQSITSQVRTAERIVDPPTGSTATVLALQTESGSTNPTIFALSDGAIVMIQGTEKRILSSPLVGITSFAIDNTSTSEDRQSIAVTFNVRRIIRMFKPLEYNAYFDTVLTVNPDDVLAEDECNCPTPYCDTTGSGQYIWHTCIEDVCIPRADFNCTEID